MAMDVYNLVNKNRNFMYDFFRYQLYLGISNVVCWLIQRITGACMIYYPWTKCVLSHVTNLNLGN